MHVKKNLALKEIKNKQIMSNQGIVILKISICIKKDLVMVKFIHYV